MEVDGFLGVVVHSYLSLSEVGIEKDLLIGLSVMFMPFGDRGNPKKVYGLMIGKWH